MSIKFNALTILPLLILLVSESFAQENAIFSNLTVDTELLINEQEHSQRPLVTSLNGQSRSSNSLDAEWIYLRDIADEFKNTASIDRLRATADSEAIAAIGQLAVSYIQRYNADSDIRRSRMCADYTKRLEAQAAEDAVESAIQNLETTDQLVARRQELGELFLKAVFDSHGVNVMNEVLSQAHAQRSLVSSHWVRTTRDMIETIGADKVAYIENSCF